VQQNALKLMEYPNVLQRHAAYRIKEVKEKGPHFCHIHKSGIGQLYSGLDDVSWLN